MESTENTAIALLQQEVKTLNNTLGVVQGDVKTLLASSYSVPQNYVSVTAFSEYKKAQEDKAVALSKLNLTRAVQQILLGAIIGGLVAFFFAHRG